MMSRSRTSGGRKSMFEEKMEDSRRLADKDRFQQCIKVLHEFLLGLGFPGTISVKSLHTTAPNDFVKVYRFAQHFSKASFQFPTNGLEGETVELLKDLGYPVALFENSVCLAVHHPELLGELWIYWIADWIINWQIVQMMCQVKAKESSSPCDVEEGAEFNEPLWEYCRDTYRKFLEGADTIEEKDKALINKLFEQSIRNKKPFISQQKKRQMLMEELETMRRECQKNRLKREGSCPQQFTPEDIERDNQESEEQSLQRYIDEINQLMRNISDSHTKLEGNGAAGVEREGTKTQKSRGGKKARRKGRK